MRTSKIGRSLAVAASIVAVCAVALPGISSAAKNGTGPKPSVLTGRVLFSRPTSAELTGVVDPHNLATSFFFQYGPTAALGGQTAPTALPVGALPVKVVQQVTGLQPGATLYYRIVAVYSATLPAVSGTIRSFASRGLALSFVVPRRVTAVAGVPFVLSGDLSGTGGGNHAVVLQASAFPYLEPFTSIGAAGLTNATGLFSFRIANLLRSTQFRVVTTELRPAYSALVNVSVSPNVTLHVRSSHSPLVRLYGTIGPAQPGVQVLIQRLKAVRPGNSGKAAEEESRYLTVVKTKAKSAKGASSSHFSVALKVRFSGRYRAYVRLASGGALVSGSSPSIVLRKH
jgi:hypothetical protein